MHRVGALAGIDAVDNGEHVVDRDRERHVVARLFVKAATSGSRGRHRHDLRHRVGDRPAGVACPGRHVDLDHAVQRLDAGSDLSVQRSHHTRQRGRQALDAGDAPDHDDGIAVGERRRVGAFDGRQPRGIRQREHRHIVSDVVAEDRPYVGAPGPAIRAVIAVASAIE